MHPSMSIIIPARDAAKTLPKLLQSLNAQIRPDGWQVEIIGVYTESEDATLDVLKAAGVRIVACPRPGPSAARNIGAGAAQGAVLYFLDADACPVGDRFFLNIAEMAERHGRFSAFGGPILLDPGQRRNPIAVGDHIACWYIWHEKRTAGPIDFQPTANFGITRRLFVRLGGFNEKLTVLEDFDLQVRLRQMRRQIISDPRLAITHRARGGLFRSWRHSWHWGLPVRDSFYKRIGRTRYPYLDRPDLFWVNLPRIFFDRAKIVWRIYRRVSPRQLWFSLPFLLATIFAWSLGVSFGRGQPKPKPLPAQAAR